MAGKKKPLNNDHNLYQHEQAWSVLRPPLGAIKRWRFQAMEGIVEHDMNEVDEELFGDCERYDIELSEIFKDLGPAWAVRCVAAYREAAAVTYDCFLSSVLILVPLSLSLSRLPSFSD